MARKLGRLDLTARIEGLDDLLRSLNSLETEVRRNANGELRKTSKQIAQSYVMPMLGGSGAPQEAAILAAAGPKSDRYVVVAVPNRKPRLSGVKKTPADMAKRLVYAVEGGSDEAQFRGAAKGSMIARHMPRIQRVAVPRYLAAVETLCRRYGLQ